MFIVFGFVAGGQAVPQFGWEVAEAGRRGGRQGEYVFVVFVCRFCFGVWFCWFLTWLLVVMDAPFLCMHFGQAEINGERGSAIIATSKGIILRSAHWRNVFCACFFGVFVFRIVDRASHSLCVVHSPPSQPTLIAAPHKIKTPSAFGFRGQCEPRLLQRRAGQEQDQHGGRAVQRRGKHQPRGQNVCVELKFHRQNENKMSDITKFHENQFAQFVFGAQVDNLSAEINQLADDIDDLTKEANGQQQALDEAVQTRLEESKANKQTIAEVIIIVVDFEFCGLEMSSAVEFSVSPSAMRMTKISPSWNNNSFPIPNFVGNWVVIFAICNSCDKCFSQS